MKWRKSPDSLVRLFDHSLPIIEGVQRRAMFGYPCALFNGHLFCGLHRDGIIVLLPEARRKALVAEGASVFEPTPGQAMREYVVVPAEIVADRQRLRALLSDALAHASSLAPKPDGPSARKAAKRSAPAKRPVRARKASAPARASARKTAPARRVHAKNAAPAAKARAKTKEAHKAPAKKHAPSRGSGPQR